MSDSSITPPSVAAADFALDTEQQTLASAWRDYKSKLRSGDLGIIPSVLAITVLVFIFSVSTDTFLSLINLQNFLQQAAPIAVIAMAVSFVLLLGEIDLAAGYTAGVCAAVMAIQLREAWPLAPALLLSSLVAIVLGVFTGLLVAKLGIPSFIVTLSNFLTFQGILLLLVKEGGTVRVENDAILALVTGNMSVAASWVMALLGIAALGYLTIRKVQHNRNNSPVAYWLRFGAISAIIVVFTALLSIDRSLPNATKQQIGIPYAVPAVLIILLILTFLLDRTRYGRHLYAVGGNSEAARRAGIRVDRVRLIAFTLCAFVAGIGGYFLASKTGSVSASTGGNETLLLAVGAAVIGGTSLFGGKGRMINAVLGALVLALIPNGLPLMGTKTIFGVEIEFNSAGIQFILSGLFLLAASSVDAISRKRSA
jgi:D-xylose transport system permease protein